MVNLMTGENFTWLIKFFPPDQSYLESFDKAVLFSLFQLSLFLHASFKPEFILFSCVPNTERIFFKIYKRVGFNK